MEYIVYCPCGSDITQKSAKQHLKTMKHKEYLKLKELTRNLSDLSITREAE